MSVNSFIVALITKPSVLWFGSAADLVGVVVLASLISDLRQAHFHRAHQELGGKWCNQRRSNCAASPVMLNLFRHCSHSGACIGPVGLIAHLAYNPVRDGELWSHLLEYVSLDAGNNHISYRRVHLPPGLPPLAQEFRAIRQIACLLAGRPASQVCH